MKKAFGVLGLAAVVGAILAIGLTGSVFAADGNLDQGNQTQNQGEVCLGGEGDCIPNEYLAPGPHGLGNAVPTSASDLEQGTKTQNQGEVCLGGEGDCVPNEYLAPGPHGAQQGSSD
jgi:hypothetical protein